MDGTVSTFDVHSGTGVIDAGDGSALPFHCTAIDGGNRTIDPGTAVEFDVTPGHLGRWEATGIRRV
jgi:cold shock CspA family protein